MTDNDIRALMFKMGALIVIGMIVQLSVIFYVFYAGYEGRKDLVNSQRAGCKRGKLDRGANAAGWRIAQSARMADNQFAVAARYSQIAGGLEERSRIDCAKAYPKASIIP